VLPFGQKHSKRGGDGPQGFSCEPNSQIKIEWEGRKKTPKKANATGEKKTTTGGGWLGGGKIRMSFIGGGGKV